MALLHSIAGYEFVELQGSFIARTRQLELITRKGRDDAIVRLNHINGPPFTITSVAYVEDWVVAIDEYTNLIDGTPYSVVQYGYDMGDYWVLDVRQIDAVRIGAAVGAPANAQWKQRCQWTLKHVQPAPPNN